MKKLITAIAAVVFFVCVSPAHSMPVVFTCAYSQDISPTASASAFDFPSDLHTRALPVDGEETPLMASVVGLPSFMHFGHPKYSPSFSWLLPRSQGTDASASGAADNNISPRLTDLISILFLGIGMLTLGILKRRMDSAHHMTGLHADTSAPPRSVSIKKRSEPYPSEEGHPSRFMPSGIG
jgi:hypothetical protein